MHLSIRELILDTAGIIRYLMVVLQVVSMPVCMAVIQTAILVEFVGDMTMCLLALNNYLSVKNMLIKQVNITVRQATISFAVMWIISIGAAYIPLTHLKNPVEPACYFLNGTLNEAFLQSYPVAVIVFVTALSVLQCLTLYHLSRHKRQIVDVENTESMFIEFWITVNKNVTFVIMSLWLTFIVCSGPVCISLAVYFWCDNHCGFSRKITQIPAAFMLAKSTMFIAIFLVRLREFRQVVGRAFTCSIRRFLTVTTEPVVITVAPAQSSRLWL